MKGLPELLAAIPLICAGLFLFSMTGCAEFNPTPEQIQAVGNLVEIVVDASSGK